VKDGRKSREELEHRVPKGGRSELTRCVTVWRETGGPYPEAEMSVVRAKLPLTAAGIDDGEDLF
jgi:hypothetical protein